MKSELTVKDIQWQLNVMFSNHQYHLYNSFVYDWECDYFSRTKSVKDYEVEIKLSRSDFKKDMKKDKHRIFAALLNNQTHVVRNLGETRGVHICDYTTATLQRQRFNRRHGNGTDYGPGHKADMRPNELRDYERYAGIMGYEKAFEDLTEGEQDYYQHLEMLDGYRNYILRHQQHSIHAPATWIKIQELEKIATPHCFYYACPEGLIRPEEVPPYAGLIYHTHCATLVKKAPYLHKVHHDLTKVLLQKFYYETVQHRITIRSGKHLK